MKSSGRQKTLFDIFKTHSTMRKSPIVLTVGSFGGIIFLRSLFEIQEVIIVICGLILVNCAFFYMRSILKAIFRFILKSRQQKYDQSIPKEEILNHERVIQQMFLDHEYRMEQLKHNGYIQNEDRSMIPPANVTAETQEYLS